MVELTHWDEFPMRIIYCTLGKVVLYSCCFFFPEMILLGFSFMAFPGMAYQIRLGIRVGYRAIESYNRCCRL